MWNSDGREDDSPRGRLLDGGCHTLSDCELIAVLLGTGRPGASAVALAREFLHRMEGIARLVEVDPKELRGPGIGAAKSARILAAIEIGRRMSRSEIAEGGPLSRTDLVATYLYLRYARDGQEVMGCLYLDKRNAVIGDSEVFRGGLSRAAVEPRQIIKQGLLLSASGLILFHTHPSGDPSPSAEDLAFTRRLAGACQTMGLRLEDHLILGSTARWVSLRQRGAW